VARAASIGLVAFGAVAAASPVPIITLTHPGLIERYCVALSPAKPDDAILAEIDGMMDRFRASWADHGPKLMAATVAVTGQPYRFRETIATLHGCRDMPSYSAPLLIAVAQFTQAGAALPASSVAGLERNGGRVGGAPAGVVAPLSDFNYLLWHESTHRYVNDIISRLSGKTTPLLLKYGAENGVVTAHLHLFAIERLVWTRLDLNREYEERNARVRARGFVSATRAIDIVEAEGAQRFVDELKPARR
jgi:hypothetical protein